jgi:hypothetical protein
MTAEKLAADWLAAKREEIEATNRRLQIESDILKLMPAKEEGSSSTVLGNGWRVKTTGKLTYRAEIDRLLQLCAAWPAEAKPVKTKVEADESLLKAIRTDRPDLWRQIAPAITVKPAKTYIVIEEPTNGL